MSLICNRAISVNTSLDIRDYYGITTSIKQKYQIKIIKMINQSTGTALLL